MAEGGRLPCMASGQTSEQTVTVTETQHSNDTQESPPTMKLILRKPKPKKKVEWTTETVDNEHMDKKKSKCCCIYEKPKLFGESSSESDGDDTDHCRGHKGKCFRKKKGDVAPPNDQNPAQWSDPSHES